MELYFYKYEGCGNDFIMIDNRLMQFVAEKTVITRLCDRHFGVGADGLLLLQNREDFDFEMVYFNSDGSPATFCGNGGRCIAAFARQLGIIENSCTFLAADGQHEATILSQTENLYHVELQMSDALVYKTDKDIYYLNTGTYHVVKFVENMQQVNVVEEGRTTRYNSDYQPHGANVNFTVFEGDAIFVRTYEKGVENETLACGTGVTAAAIAASLKKGGTHFNVRTLGGNLSVSFKRERDTFTHIKLTGPAQQVFSGSYQL